MGHYHGRVALDDDEYSKILDLVSTFEGKQKLPSSRQMHQ
jgi:hypothetical protein